MLRITQAVDRVIKRKIATSSECQFDLEKELPIMFKAFSEAVILYDKEIVQTPPDARVISLEASLLNSKMIQCIQSQFPKNWKFGKYKRFMLRVQGYTVLFKKLNGKDRPMNIKTLHSSAILNQLQTSLFDGGHISIDPILIFGYKKDKLGKIFDPKLVYIDENEVRWTITENAIEIIPNVSIFAKLSTEKSLPQLKKVLTDKKVSNDGNLKN